MNCGRRLEEAKGVFPLKGADPRVKGRQESLFFLVSFPQAAGPVGLPRGEEIFFFFVFLLQLSEDERITRVGWVLLNVWLARLVGVVFFLFLFLFSAS